MRLIKCGLLEVERSYSTPIGCLELTDDLRNRDCSAEQLSSEAGAGLYFVNAGVAIGVMQRPQEDGLDSDRPGADQPDGCDTDRRDDQEVRDDRRNQRRKSARPGHG
jgi:hypothetical protein